MIRIVVEYHPRLFAILGLFDPKKASPILERDGVSFYKAESHDHYILYRQAIQGARVDGFSPLQR